MRSVTLPLYAVVAVTVLVSAVLGGVPHLINYQGRATDAAGQPLNGPCAIKFKIYGSESGTDSLWSSGSQTVTVTNGLFTYMLGSHGEVPASVFEGDDARWLGVTVGADAELTPRTQLLAVPYAYHAESADTAAFALAGASGSSGGWVDAGTNVYLTTTGDSVGIGTTDPASKLEVVAAGNAIVGHSTGAGAGVGVIGGSDGTGYGVYGSTNTGRGVFGTAYNGFGGYFTGNRNYFSENLGIGTEEPEAMLHVYEDDSGEDAYFQVETNHATNYGEAGIYFKNPSRSWRLFMDDESGDDLSYGGLGFYCSTLTSPVMALGVSGNVGIGLNPSGNVRLAIQGEADAYGLRVQALGSGCAIWGSSPTGFGAYFTAPMHYFSGLTGFGTDAPTHTVTINGAMGIRQDGTTEYHLNYYNGGLNFSETTVADYRLFVKDGGNVGIGTSNPTARLHVNGSATVSGTFTAAGFADNTIGRADIIDEVGIAGAPRDNGIHNLTTSWLPYMTRELTVPTAGYILAIGCANLYLYHEATGITGGYIGLSDNPSSVDGHHQRYSVNSNVSSGGRSSSIPCMHVFYVAAPGTYTYYLVAKRDTGNAVDLINAEMNLLFIPTVYSSDIGQLVAPDGATGNEEDSDVLQPPASSEPDVAEIADRIENLTAELADLKTQLARIQNK